MPQRGVEQRHRCIWKQNQTLGGSWDLWRWLSHSAVIWAQPYHSFGSSAAALGAGEGEGKERDEVLSVLPGPGCMNASIFALECLTCCPASLSRQLSEENANLQEYVEKEVEEKKKLSRTNEELLWKLQEGDAVSPVKLPPAPSTPFYRCSSGNSSPAKVRTLRR